jgi:uncharacterized protein YggE
MRKLLISFLLLALVAIMSSKIENTVTGNKNKVRPPKPEEQKPEEDKEKPQEQEEEEEKCEKKILTAPLTVTGTASTTVYAGVIQIGINFSTFASCASEALAENTAKVKNALRELKKFGCNQESISTVFFGITPKHRETPKPEGKQMPENLPEHMQQHRQEHMQEQCHPSEIEGWAVTQTLEVVVSSKKIAAKIIDTISNCAGFIIWVKWDIAEKAEKMARHKMNSVALENAVAIASKTAKKLGYHLQKVNRVEVKAPEPLSPQIFKTFKDDFTIVGINKTLNVAVQIEFEMMKVQIVKKERKAEQYEDKDGKDDN